MKLKPTCWPPCLFACEHWKSSKLCAEVRLADCPAGSIALISAYLYGRGPEVRCAQSTEGEYAVEFDLNKLIARVKNVLLTPKTEWPVIAAEAETVQGLYTKYIIWLA